MAGADAGAGDRVHRVDHQVEHDLFELVAVAIDPGCGARLDLDHDAGHRQVLLHQVDGVARDLDQVQPAALGARGPREIQQSLDDPAALLGLADDAADIVLLVLAVRGVLEHLRRQQDRPQRRVELVRDAGRQLADAHQLLGLAEAALELLL